MSNKKSRLLTRRQMLRSVGLAISAATVSRFGLQSARAATYPDRPIKIIVPFAPAGPTDIMARILAQNLGAAIAGNIITENRSGAGGNIGIGYVAHAEPDGYTLLGHLQRLCRQSQALRQSALRSLQGFRADRRTRHLAECDPDRSQARHQLHRRIDRARQGESR